MLKTVGLWRVYTRISVHGLLQTASASDKPSLELQLAQIDRDIETADKEITKMSFLVPEARGTVTYFINVG